MSGLPRQLPSEEPHKIQLVPQGSYENQKASYPKIPKSDKAMQYRYSEAEKELAEQLVWKRRSLGDKHPETLEMISRYGGLLYTLGKYEEAELCCREVLEKTRTRFGDEHRRTIDAAGNMAAVLKELGREEEAAPLFEEAAKGRAIQQEEMKKRQKELFGDDGLPDEFEIMGMPTE